MLRGDDTSHAGEEVEGVEEETPPLPFLPLLNKKKKGIFSYESMRASPPKMVLPPSPQKRVVRGSSGFAQGHKEEEEEEEGSSRQLRQLLPQGYKVGRSQPFLAYFKTPEAGQYNMETERELPQLAACRAAKGELKGGAWDPSQSYHDNASRFLNLFAISLLEEEAADLSSLRDVSAPNSLRGGVGGGGGGGGRRATAPVSKSIASTLQPYEAFQRPLVWVPTSASVASSSSSSSSSSYSSTVLSLPGPCMLISKAKMASLAGGGTGLWDGQLGYANLLLGSFPAGHGISEGVHRLVKEFIMGPSPAIQLKRGGRQPVYPKGGYWVCCHICGNRSCLHPFHLVWGSEADNKRDEMATYQRLAREQGHPEWAIPREIQPS